MRAHLIEAARGWEAGGEDAGELYRGARLATAIDWTAEHSRIEGYESYPKIDFPIAV